MRLRVARKVLMGVLMGGGYRGTTFWRAIDRYYVASKRARKRGHGTETVFP